MSSVAMEVLRGLGLEAARLPIVCVPIEVFGHDSGLSATASSQHLMFQNSHLALVLARKSASCGSVMVCSHHPVGQIAMAVFS